MKKIVILFFGTSRGFIRFTDDIYQMSDNIEYKLCDSINKIRGINFDGYMIHYSASEEFQQEIKLNEDLLQHLISRQIN